jgi:hypothetical protein
MTEITKERLIEQLNAPTADERLHALNELRMQPGRTGAENHKKNTRDVNNHIHTTYSFSPYSPTKAVWMSWMAGLDTAGIMDHDTISGAREFIEAGKIMSLPVTIGAECRSSFASTALAGRRINNPDQDTVAYMALHGVPHSQIDALNDFFKPVQKSREDRNRRMMLRLNKILEPFGLYIDYDADVISISQSSDGGSITERHLLFALSLKLIERFGSGQDLVDFLKQKLTIAVSAKSEKQLTAADNPYLAYDLLGLLKSELVEKIYLPADEAECPQIKSLVEFSREHGILLAYPYLGDITESVTGDKKAQKFEDSYLDELFELLDQLGIKAVTYMPSRNTPDQLKRLVSLCEKYNMFQISGEDINQPRQEFVCKAMRDPFFSKLFDAAWALIGHEIAASNNLDDGMFSEIMIKKIKDLNQRVEFFRDLAKSQFQ